MTPKELERLKSSSDPYAFGVVPSPIDTRDFAFAPPRATPTPATFLNKAVGKLPVRDQQGGTCVGNSIALCMQMLEYGETGRLVPFNGELINGRVVGREYGEGAGMVPRDGLDDVLHHGVAAFLGDEGVSLYFPKAYALVDHTNPQAVREAISTPGVAVTAACWLLSNFGTGGDNPAWGSGKDNGGKAFTHDIPGEQSLMYHELTFVGYTAEGVIYQNSWGNTWGDGGLGRFAWDYVTSTRVGEMWAITDSSDAVGGRVDEWHAPVEAATGRAVRKGTSAAVYLVETGGRIWIQSLLMAKQMGVDMAKVQSLPPTDKVWNTPVIGPDAPLQYQG